ncbi:MAG: heme oxygenase (biliverdin-producing) [Cyanobacteria bacterium P01_A01_bin.123]
MSSNLATKLRVGTKKAHTMAENVGFVKCFLKGVVEKKSYRILVSNFYFVYSEMEDQMHRHKEHPVLSKIYFPLLNRRSSLEKDLSFYYGADWQKNVAASPAAQAYVQRIQNLSHTEPELLIAHAYTRYMGDLSGGQILKEIAQRAMNLSGGQGTEFYEFKDIADEKQFKALYRQRLNELSFDETMVNRIMDEANIAFEMNMKLFQELEGSMIKAIGQLLFNTLTRRRDRGSTELVTAD